MTFVDMLRLNGPMMLMILIGIVVIFVVAHFLPQFLGVDAEGKRYVCLARNVIVAIMAAIMAFQLVLSASVNVVPQSVIDHSSIEKQADQMEDRISSQGR